jgi:hypothetical protein
LRVQRCPQWSCLSVSRMSARTDLIVRLRDDRSAMKKSMKMLFRGAGNLYVSRARNFRTESQNTSDCTQACGQFLGVKMTSDRGSAWRVYPTVRCVAAPPIATVCRGLVLVATDARPAPDATAVAAAGPFGRSS